MHKKGRKIVLPPGPRSLPIIGNFHMLGSLPHRALENLAKKYGPIMSLRLGHVPTIVVSSSQTAELFLRTHDAVFASRPIFQASKIIGMSKGIAFSEYGPYWRSLRKLVASQLLSASKIESFAPMRKELVGSLVQSLKKTAVAHEVVDLSEVVGKLIEESTCRMVFGRSHHDRFDLKELIAETLNLMGAFNLADYVPYLGALDLQGLTSRIKKLGKTLDVVLENVIQEHEQIPSGPQSCEKDFIDMYSLMNQPMNAHDENSCKIDRRVIKAIIIDMITATYDTSAISIEWTISELLRHPRIMKHVQDELERVIGMNRMVEETDLANLTYLSMVIKESFRLHSVAPFLIPRESMEDIEINGYYIPKKSRVVINSWAIGRDPYVWSDNVEEFYPERFINSNIDLKGHDFQLIPFGSGRRGCPGLQLGLTTVTYVLAQLLHCFDWVLPNGMLPNDLDMSEKFGLSMPRAKHLLAMPTYRLLG
ncbi:cytochrome P450 CYP736A12-like isoform X1 [Quercus robur]|uniref:cytochrome P450 CYP736A12-like isoform X1 n=1 Tax=Quercus robur TaxID=38942 RepID=UPI00216383EA|nr:cytochrome P450 CYP736A12-like isoform X1 [Quercus robur]